MQRLSRTLERELRQFDTTRHGLEGKQEAGALFPQHLENEVRMLSALGREESDELARLLRKLLESHGDTSLT
ncbi:hypothetical protein [Streptomyces sp. ADI93-02]|uniref:hypothetical protein n=1 Tax=Streptomyces sp. ADI93-02 TaxID=1522757 RepID=UPI0019CF9044|nr:hypothetical protein [Streptomyces sp. ADI93-02]